MSQNIDNINSLTSQNMCKLGHDECSEKENRIIATSVLAYINKTNVFLHDYIFYNIRYTFMN